ncbi:hypothetical protein [Mesorhizobium jarvisii]|jgi:hypothetical protein|uniref:hypothetical protein n=1 Tax=Mesorhizobium jarvisii TaxID=1777867 RepID=UPI000AB1B849|nr:MULTISPECIES: hypothetical protein [Mesorhizobium]
MPKRSGRQGFRFVSDTIPLRAILYHCEVWGADPRPEKFTGSQEKSLFKACGWYVPIEGVEIIGGP